MKTLLFNYKFLVLALAILPLSMCSKDDDGEEAKFEPVTIELSGLDVKNTDSSFQVDGFHFRSTRAESTEDGIGLWYPENSNPSYIELDLEQITGVTKITLNIFNNAGNTKASIWNDGKLIEENDDIPNADINVQFKETTIHLDNREVDNLRISSFEAIIKSIKLE